MSEQKENSMSAAARLRELHYRGSQSARIGRHGINSQILDALPEIAAVIEAAQKVSPTCSHWYCHETARELGKALAALSARLNGGE